MIATHFAIRESHGRHVAFCRCGHHHPVGAWSAAELARKIQETQP